MFLDEIGELPVELQPKLLRVLERKEIKRLGAARMQETDVRVVAATHRDLLAMVRAGTFREDLYYRLAEVVVDLPRCASAPATSR
ncbi:MAG: sigma-54 factor interaction domain-containing protein [Sandaracinaceae bacterium]|nr:sigma-54 factor interaction domain-containing protein [Sandaracinaceae bacterium]